ncbi:hypothetical protein C8Q80DRAFT_1116905 [Daedaleopsis nitida]|nr:hypothetical protein C8Q80DRAFT_1116905 [Daedaleopsis nitida]
MLTYSCTARPFYVKYSIERVTGDVTVLKASLRLSKHLAQATSRVKFASFGSQRCDADCTCDASSVPPPYFAVPPDEDTSKRAGIFNALLPPPSLTTDRVEEPNHRSHVSTHMGADCYPDNRMTSCHSLDRTSVTIANTAVAALAGLEVT